MALAALVMVGASEAHSGWAAAITGLLLVGVPALDTGLVIVSRRRRGVSVMTAGRDHLTHRTRALLKTTRSTVAVLAGVQALLAAAAIGAAQGDRTLLVAVGVLYVAVAASVIAALVAAQRPAAARRGRRRDPRHARHRTAEHRRPGDPGHHADEAARAAWLRDAPDPRRRGAARGLAGRPGGAYGVQPLLVPGLRRELHRRRPQGAVELARTLRAFRPHIVHTHLAKAGTLGRIAALTRGAPRPPIFVHTFHGHSLEGYFSARRTAVFRAIERTLGRRCARLIAVSSEVSDDLVRLGVAARDRSRSSRWVRSRAVRVTGAKRAARARVVRDQLGVPPDARLVTLVARLVPIKRVDRFLRVASEIARQPRRTFRGRGRRRAARRARRRRRSAGRWPIAWSGRASDATCPTSALPATSSC